MEKTERSEPAVHAVGIPVERMVGQLVPERAVDATWEDVAEREYPTEWRDTWRYRVVCSNGFVGPYGLDSALLHKPDSWPQCFPAGAAADSCCALTVQRKAPNARLKGARAGANEAT